LVRERHGLARRRSRLAALILTALGAAVLVLGATGRASSAEVSFGLGDAAQQGTFNVGAAEASLAPRPEASGGRAPFALQVRVPPGTAAGLWAKGFPAGLAAGNVDVVRFGARVPDALLGTISVALEVKGTAGTQRLPLDLQSGWTYHEAALDWPRVGRVNEVVCLISPIGDRTPPAGRFESVDVDVHFARLSWVRRLSTTAPGRMSGVVALGVLGAGLTWLLRRLRVGGSSEESRGPRERGLARDFVAGAGLVFIAVLVVAVYEIGARGPLEAGWTSLAVAVAGAAVAQWWKRGLTGANLTPLEVVQNLLATGVLAAASSPLAILQVPGAWPDVLLLSQTVAAAATLVYHLASVARLATSGRHLGDFAGALIVGTPFAIGALVVLESGPLLQSLGAVLVMGSEVVAPLAREVLGRVALLFGFNVLAANALGLVTRRTLLRSGRAYAAMLAVAAAAVAAPWIAAYASALIAPSSSDLFRLMVAVVGTVLSQVGLWAEGYLVTGMILDAIHGRAPSRETTASHPLLGVKKGAVYSGTFMAILYGLALLWGLPGVRAMASASPQVVALVFGALAFPLAKTIIETFDGSYAFFQRVGRSYRQPILYLRGAVVGLGFGYGLTHAMADQEMAVRSGFGLAVGVASLAGVNLVRDAFGARTGRGQIQPWRVYLVQALLGGFIGAAIGFYLDRTQVSVVVDKYHRYLGAGWAPEHFGERPLLSKWGFIDLGTITGGVGLFFCEALAGVVSWSIPAWLFALNRTFMAACFRRETAPIRALFTRDGVTQLTQNMIEVLRWGLWMSPIIKSFLRPMGEPTWYNQDGAIRTLWAIVQDVRLSPAEFRAWSLHVFIALLAYDAVRILIWVDHMGLRVATLVNLSFLGMDRLEARLARFLAPAATARCIPEAVKRFTTWAPLLIPFYIPRGKDWDFAWSQSEILQRSARPGPIAVLLSQPLTSQLLAIAGAIAACTAALALVRRLQDRFGAPRRMAWSLANPEYEVVLEPSGAVVSQARDRGYDVSRRSYDLMDPCGRTLFVVEVGADGRAAGRSWPVLGNYPAERAAPASCSGNPRVLKASSTEAGVRTTVAISLPGAVDPVELWTIAVENLTDRPRLIKLVPYLEWVLNRPEADRGHTQYNRLFAEIEYAPALHAVLASDRHSKAVGLLASDMAPEGFLTARIDFIGRARSVWTPEALDTLAFAPAEDTEARPTLDPIGSLLLGITLKPHATAQVRLLIGLVRDKASAADAVARYLGLERTAAVPAARREATVHPLRHGRVPPGTPRPYSEFSDDGRTLLVATPFSPRPIDHLMANQLGHIVAVTNRGLHTSASVNSQQNRLTPDWPDTVTREVPGEAFYLYEPARSEWFSPTYHPLNDQGATYEVEFGVDGTAGYRMRKGDLETELTVFVPPDDPVGVYLLTVRNHSNRIRQLRLAPYFQMVLADQPEHSGPLAIRFDETRSALFFENPRNGFRTGPAFVALSCEAECVVTERGRFFGAGRSVAHPSLVERGVAGSVPTGDDRPVAAFVAALAVPARGESTVVVVLGQADRRADVEAVIRKYRDPAAVLQRLEETRAWWLRLMETVSVETTHKEFDQTLNWLKYQALAERIWARRGFYQASGAYGFRDQLQDAVNLIWVDPVVARRQILLHASQQFLEGDVVHWFHRLQDGRTGFVARTHASDNLLWLVWGVVEYVSATGDASILDERAAYLEAEQPFEPLPRGKHGMGFDPLRSARVDTIYAHCQSAIDLVLDHRMGAHGLPLIGTGDWNDGLDEIGSQGKGESIWLGFFLLYILKRFQRAVDRSDADRTGHYRERQEALERALEQTWRGDRYLRAIHDDGTEIGVAGSGVWEIDALTAAWAVMSGINPERGRIVFDTAVQILERETTVLLGWPPLREDTTPYLGRSSGYPEGVRENGMYCHGVQWLVGAARILAEQFQRSDRPADARQYRETAWRLWLKTSPIPHGTADEVETYGGQPNKQAADMVTTFAPGRMIWHGYTGAAGWMFRQALEGVLGFRLEGGQVIPPSDLATGNHPAVIRVARDVSQSPFPGPAVLRPAAQRVDAEETTHHT
jgi:cyclic beta-1,2-glucan synthetase